MKQIYLLCFSDVLRLLWTPFCPQLSKVQLPGYDSFDIQQAIAGVYSVKCAVQPVIHVCMFLPLQASLVQLCHQSG